MLALEILLSPVLLTMEQFIVLLARIRLDILLCIWVLLELGMVWHVTHCRRTSLPPTQKPGPLSNPPASSFYEE